MPQLLFNRVTLPQLLSNQATLPQLLPNWATWPKLLSNKATLPRLHQFELLQLLSNQVIWSQLFTPQVTLSQLLANQASLVQLPSHQATLPQLLSTQATLPLLFEHPNALAHLIPQQDAKTQLLKNPGTLALLLTSSHLGASSTPQGLRLGRLDCNPLEPCGLPSALIYLHALGPSNDQICQSIVDPLTLLKSVVVSCPLAPVRPVDAIPVSFLQQVLPGFLSVSREVRSWFNFQLPPGLALGFDALFGGNENESSNDLEVSMRRVEGVIESLNHDGIPSKNIVVMGVSQGGALALYMATHTSIKLGGFVGIVTWLPGSRDASTWSRANQDTPIYLVNGLLDFIVPTPSGGVTSRALGSFFSSFTFRQNWGSHTTMLNPFTYGGVRDWLRDNTPLSNI